MNQGPVGKSRDQARVEHEAFLDKTLDQVMEYTKLGAGYYVIKSPTGVLMIAYPEDLEGEYPDYLVEMASKLEITEGNRLTIRAWIEECERTGDRNLLPHMTLFSPRPIDAR